MAQRVKDLALSLLWHGFDSWPRKFHMLEVRPKKERKTTRTHTKPQTTK